jgi:hypothetical protein
MFRVVLVVDDDPLVLNVTASMLDHGRRRLGRLTTTHSASLGSGPVCR